MPKFNMSWIYIMVLIALVAFYFSGGDSIGGGMNKKATYTEFNGNPQAKNAIFVSREKATPSAIDNTTVAGKAQKMIIDGQLFIIRDGVMFNANGAAVK